MRSRARVYRTGFGGYQFAILKEPGALAVIAAREFLGYGLDKREVRWPGGARVAVSFVVNFEGGWGISPSATLEQRLKSTMPAWHALDLRWFAAIRRTALSRRWTNSHASPPCLAH
jgi:hypothetical protein